MPLEQLIPAPLTTMTRLLFATARDTSDSARLAEKSAGLVEDKIRSRGRCVIGMAAFVMLWRDSLLTSDKRGFSNQAGKLTQQMSKRVPD